MNWSRLGYGVVLADFSALTAYAVYRHGFVGVFEQLFANAATITLFVDVCIALGLVGLWMIRDARERGGSALPYVLLTIGFGSVGPLLYLFRRAGAEQPAPLAAVAERRLA